MEYKGQDKSDKSTGWKFDAGKSRYELLPKEALEGVVRVLTYGANKYAPNNWRKVTPIYRYYGALLRHLEAVRTGEWTDTESGLPHLDHAMCCLVFMRELLKDHDEQALFTEFQGE